MAKVSGSFTFAGEQVHSFETVIAADSADVLGQLAVAIESAKDESDRYLTEKIEAQKAVEGTTDQKNQKNKKSAGNKGPAAKKQKAAE
jgi:hypothetical protein